jgi:hypothetical protein
MAERRAESRCLALVGPRCADRARRFRFSSTASSRIDVCSRCRPHALCSTLARHVDERIRGALHQSEKNDEVRCDQIGSASYLAFIRGVEMRARILGSIDEAGPVRTFLGHGTADERAFQTQAGRSATEKTALAGTSAAK